jgi:hypothetical protein
MIKIGIIMVGVVGLVVVVGGGGVIGGVVVVGVVVSVRQVKIR